MTQPYKTLDEFPKLRIYADGKIYDERIGRCRKQTSSGDGYMNVNAYDIAGKSTRTNVHRLLAMAWIPNPDKLSDVDHVDHDKTNNNLENLRWVSHRTNQRNQSKRNDNTSGYQGVFYKPQNAKPWQSFWVDANGKRTTKSFKHKGDAIEHREQMVNKYYERPKPQSQDSNLCPAAKLFKKYMLLQLRLAFKHEMIFLRQIPT